MMFHRNVIAGWNAIWVIRGNLSRRIYLAFALTGLLLPLAGWWGLSVSGWMDKVFMPGPVDVVLRIYLWFKENDLMGDIWISTYRVIAGFTLSAVLAIPIGLMIGTYRPVQAMLEPLTDFIRYMPAVAFIPLVMLWVGIDESSKIAIIFIGTFFQMVLMVAEDVRRVPITQIEAAQTMGANRGEIVALVIVQSAKPALLDTLRVTMGWAWTYLVVAELVAANSGLGIFDPQGATLHADRQDIRRNHPDRSDRAGDRPVVPLAASQELPLAIQ